MREGTKKLFPTDYERFKECMIEAANDNSLPVTIELDDIRDYTLKDIQDAFDEFNMDTSLELTGYLYFCQKCKKLHLVMDVNRLSVKETHLLQ